MTVRPETPPEEHRTLILTGASRGIGHATVKRFSSAGWRVITCSRHAFPENCPWAAGPEDHIQVDLADPDDTLRAVAEMRERLKDGKLHALVNNAGISPKRGPSGGAKRPSPPPRGEVGKSQGDFPGGGAISQRLDALHTDMATWRHVFEVNVFSTIWLAQGLKDALARAHGAIVNVTSIAGSRVHPFAGAAYATSKAALAALTREMAADFGPLGVRVNAIAPGEIDTAILSPGTDKLVETLPMRRLGLPEEVAKAIYYLCTDQSSYVTGAELHINGGQHV
ncbi:MAG: SDR family oxidoreductase [Alphaproteobacteria bacterium]|nr:SDR family oxidoreductase [Alphaproteobacteria bacterium]MBL6937883.1 SDR family oxidoreductase [Alphaproteobacteria bacterium]MBL7099292.1 SDR family oxidoreductase [Alphaproteobacteria bacterium]